jgi:pimeloyl-ACP methyl ester carboxylesterase
MKPMPSKWDSIVTYCGWRGVPSVFVLATEDKMIPPEIQERLAGFSASEKVVRVEAGHMLQLSKPKEVAQIIADFAGK